MHKIPVVGKFHKVSLKEFSKHFPELSEEEIKKLYDEVLVLPVRASHDSMGNDFVITKDIDLGPGESVKIATGIRAEMLPGWGLIIAPRSGLGSKFRMQIDNTLGIIDGDYFYADNEGHIMASITNDSREGKRLQLKAGERFMQGVFMPYGVAAGDKPLGVRTGGEGSSGL